MKPATLDQLKACQFSSWYPRFRHLNSTKPDANNAIGNTANTTKIKTSTPGNGKQSNDERHPRRIEELPFQRNNVTIRSIIISPLPQDFIDYLKSDGIILPKGAEQVSSFLPTEHYDDDENDDDDDDVEENLHSTSSSSHPDMERENSLFENEGNTIKRHFHFPQLNQQIQSALDTLGPCLPKLNWSAPRDVSWLNQSTLKCNTVGDVYLLLKSSDFCMFDLEHALDDIELHTGDDHDVGSDNIKNDVKLDYELVLRKWSNLHASMEFRCFVSNHGLVGICQRNHTEHYPHLPRESLKIKNLIMDFFSYYIQYNFANGWIEDYVFDVYVDKHDRVWLIDFNLWSTRTDALMFTWEELIQLSETQQANEKNDVGLPEMRIVRNENDVRFDPLASYRAPIDTVALATDQEGLQSFDDFMAMCVKPSEILAVEDD